MDVLLHCVLQNALFATVLALLAAGAGKYLRRPALAHVLWTLVLVKLITPPLFEVPIPGNAGILDTGSQPHVEAAAEIPSPEAPRSGSSVVSAAPAASASGPRDELAAGVENGGPHYILWPTGATRWKAIGLCIGLCGSLFWFTRAAVRIRRFGQLMSYAHPASAELVGRVEECAARIGLARCPRVLLLPTAVSPTVWGAGRRASLVLPQGLLDTLTPEQLTHVVIHELAHLRRGDHWVRLLELVVTGLCWWHPVVWWARRRLRQVEEEACDAWVVWAAPGARLTYVDTLLSTMDFLSEARRLPSPLASEMGHARFVKRRLVMILEHNTPPVLSVRSRIVVLTLAAALLPLGLARAGAEDVPTLEEIEAGLTQRQHRIGSLYVETVGETSSPFGPDVLRQLPDDYRFRPGSGLSPRPKVEYHYASKGEKRYSRKRRPQESSYRDQMWAYNGTSVWVRHETVHPDGDAKKDKPRVAILPPEKHMRFVYPEEWRALNVGVAIAGPDLAAKNPWQDLFYFDATEPPQRQTFTVSDEVEQVDGARCVALAGTIEMNMTLEAGPKKLTRHVRFWLDLDRGLALRQWEESFLPGEKPRHRVVNSRFEEVEPGLWLPRRTEIQMIAPAEQEGVPDPYRGKLIFSTRIEVTRWIVGQVSDDVFDPSVEPGDDVRDLRTPGLARDAASSGG